MTIEIWLIIALLFSIMINFILVWLSRKQSDKLLVTSENLEDLVELLSNYESHLSSVYQMEAFYGDESLEFLLKHTNSLRELLEEQYGDVMSITGRIEYQAEEEEEIAQEEKKFEPQKDVFYGGSRRSDS